MVARSWQLQEAKNRLSEVVDRAVSQGPQVITRRGVETAIVLSCADYHRLAAKRESLSEFFRNSPLAESEIDLERDKSPTREVAL